MTDLIVSFLITLNIVAGVALIAGLIIFLYHILGMAFIYCIPILFLWGIVYSLIKE